MGNNFDFKSYLRNNRLLVETFNDEDDDDFYRAQEAQTQALYDKGYEYYQAGDEAMADEYYNKAMMSGDQIGWTEEELPPYDNLPDDMDMDGFLEEDGEINELSDEDWENDIKSEIDFEYERGKKAFFSGDIEGAKEQYSMVLDIIRGNGHLIDPLQYPWYPELNEGFSFKKYLKNNRLLQENWLEDGSFKTNHSIQGYNFYKDGWVFHFDLSSHLLDGIKNPDGEIVNLAEFGLENEKYPDVSEEEQERWMDQIINYIGEGPKY